jgi:hypothetical protein
MTEPILFAGIRKYCPKCEVAMNNIAKLPFETVGADITHSVEAAARGGHCGILTGLAGYCRQQVARMAIAGHYGFPDPPGASVASLSSYGYYANLIVGRLRQPDGGKPN